MTESTKPHVGLARMRDPFATTDYGRLPKPLRKDDTQKGKCEDTPQGRQFSADRYYCGGYHTRSLHLSYVGHAALTQRLLESDDHWTWEPLAYDPTGLPLIDRNGGLWIKLTVAGVTRLGYGDAPGKTGGNAIKEVIGDALRNAAMRFGAALELWHKGELSEFAEPPEPGADDVSRETSQGGTPEPMPETPIPDTPAEPGDFDWAKAITDATSKADITELWHKAVGLGVMEVPLKIGRRKERPLVDILTEVGKAFADAEEAAAKDQDAGPAVLADDATGEVRE